MRLLAPNNPAPGDSPISFVQNTANEPGAQASPQSFSITPAAEGNLQLLMYNARSSTSAVISSVTGAGAPSSGPGSWVRVAGPLANDSGVYGPEEIWASTVQTPGATTITVNWSGTFTGGTFAVMEFDAVTGAATTWIIVTDGTTFDLTSGTTIPFPTLTSVEAGECYCGIQYSNVGTGGASPGFTTITTGIGRNITYNTDLAAATQYSPTGTQTGLGVGDSSVAVIVRAT
jgi:hypothetical protein